MIYSFNLVANSNGDGGLVNWTSSGVSTGNILDSPCFIISPGGSMSMQILEENVDGVIGGYFFSVDSFVDSNSLFKGSDLSMKLEVKPKNKKSDYIYLVNKKSDDFKNSYHEILLGKHEVLVDGELTQKYYFIEDIEYIKVVIKNNGSDVCYVTNIQAKRMIDDEATLETESGDASSAAQEKLIYLFNGLDKTIGNDYYDFSRSVSLLYETHMYFDIIATGVADSDSVLYTVVEVNGQVYHHTKNRIFTGDNTISISVTAPAIQSGPSILRVRFKTDSGTFEVPKSNLQISVKAYGLLNALGGGAPSITLIEEIDTNSLITLDDPEATTQIPISESVVEEITTSIEDTVTIELT